VNIRDRKLQFTGHWYAKTAQACNILNITGLEKQAFGVYIHPSLQGRKFTAGGRDSLNKRNKTGKKRNKRGN